MPTKKNKNVSGGTYLVSSNEELHDDCPVCRLMKKAEQEGREPTKEELEEAFTKANTQN